MYSSRLTGVLVNIQPGQRVRRRRRRQRLSYPITSHAPVLRPFRLQAWRGRRPSRRSLHGRRPVSELRCSQTGEDKRSITALGNCSLLTAAEAFPSGSLVQPPQLAGRSPLAWRLRLAPWAVRRRSSRSGEFLNGRPNVRLRPRLGSPSASGMAPSWHRVNAAFERDPASFIDYRRCMRSALADWRTAQWGGGRAAVAHGATRATNI